MKYTCILLILLLGSCSKAKHKSTEFIEFAHTGTTTKITRPLIISTDTIKINLTNEQMSELKNVFEGHGPITNNRKELFVKANYNRIITDNNTFQSINEFILSHKEFYGGKIHQNGAGDESFDIIVNGTDTYSIYYKSKDNFFDSLINYLKGEHRDIKVIDEVYYLGRPPSKELGTN